MRLIQILFMFCLVFVAHAETGLCPDPKTSSLKWGEIPFPWKVSPFSEHTVQRDEQTQFINAQILVAGYGQGVVCTYEYSLGRYSIWWQTLVKIPARSDWYWMDTNIGYLCSDSIENCKFSVGRV